MTIHMIWAEARDGVIGAKGEIPWRVPGEQKIFKERTMGSTVVMGRATWDSLPARVRPAAKTPTPECGWTDLQATGGF